jgi:predicted phosphohydrolase
MSLFTIADLHLSIATDHPMDVFGSRWKDYLKKIEKN